MCLSVHPICAHLLSADPSLCVCPDTNMDGKLSIGQLKEVLRAQGFDTMREDLREALEGKPPYTCMLR